MTGGGQVGNGELLELASPPSDTSPELVAQDFTSQEAPHEAAMNSAPQEGYVYTRADGTVERADTADDAMRLCPVLGKIALRDPKLAKMMLEVSSMGSAKMAEAIPTKRPESKKPTLPELVKEKVTASLRSGESVHEVAQTEDSIRALRHETSDDTVVERVVHQPEKRPAKALVLMDESLGVANHKLAEAHLIAAPEREQQIILSRAEADSVASPRLAAPLPESWHFEIAQGEQSLEAITAPTVAASEQPEATNNRYVIPDVAQEVMLPEKAEDSLPDASGDEETLFFPDELDAGAPNQFMEADEGGSMSEAVEEEPEKLYEGFIGALQDLGVRSVELRVAVNEQDMVEGTFIEDGEQLDESPVPAIVGLVVERLVQLEPEERLAVAPILRDIVAVQLDVWLSDSSEVGTDIVETTEERLQELVTTLLDSIGIDYEEEDSMLLVRSLLRPDFRPLQAEEPAEAVDLEYVGTREAKHHFPKVTVTLDGLEDRLKRALGMTALFNARSESKLGVPIS